MTMIGFLYVTGKNVEVLSCVQILDKAIFNDCLTTKSVKCISKFGHGNLVRLKVDDTTT